MSLSDITLIAAVSLMGTAVAYLRNPRHKAMILMFPIPFTFAALAVGQPVDATNVIGVGVTVLFSTGIWLLHGRLRWPIIPVIALCGVGYCVIGAALAKILPTGDTAFWLSVVSVGTGALLLIRLLPHRDEPHYRTSLPVYIKLPAIALMIIGIVTIKQQLGGFMTVFPMLGTITAYEARHSLWTILRRIPWVILMFLPMIVVMRLTQDALGLGGALLCAWPVYLICLWLARKLMSHRFSRSQSVLEPGR